MYPYIELLVRPSSFLIRLHGCVQFSLFVVALPWAFSHSLYWLLLTSAQMAVVYVLVTRRLECQRSSAWRLQNGRWYFAHSPTEIGSRQLSDSELTFNEVVDLKVIRRLPFWVQLRFRLDSGGEYVQDILSDRVDAEAFRRFRVMLKGQLPTSAGNQP